jgi:hypothetical protein
VPLVFLIHLGATWALVGLIWFVQVVHYPLFAEVDRGRFRSYEAQHTRRTGWLVGVLMPIEAGTALWLAWDPPNGTDQLWLVLGLGLVGALWLTTLLVHVPMHRRLSTGFDAESIRRLVATNWIRTILWSMRGLLILSVAASLAS